MNAAEKIVEAYFRYIRGVFTRTSLRGEGQAELDIVGVNPNNKPPVYYHVESTVSISSAYSKITNEPYSYTDEKDRQKKAGQRRTAGFFIQKKFFAKDVEAILKKEGCKLDTLQRIIVAWEFDKYAQKILEEKGIECLTMKQVFQELADRLAEETCDIDSDILRTIQLFVRAQPKMPIIYSVQSIRDRKRRITTK